MSVLAAILSILLALTFLAGSPPKIARRDSVYARVRHLGFSQTLYQVVGVLELAAAIGLVIGLWVRWLGALAAAGLVLLMIGALVYHVRARDTGKNAVPAAVILVVAVVALISRLASL
ncbi:MAG: DoxX family protein [Mycobacteriales bacterium]|jgi:uncharacterized membrane protein YphA (DoxX/SURF4 family)